MTRISLLIILFGASVASATEPEIDQATPKRLSELRTTVESNPAVNKRYKALEIFFKIAPRNESISLLISALNDQSPHIRGLAARILGEIGPKASSAVPLLAIKLNDEEYRARWISNHFAIERAVRFDVCEALGRIGTAAKVAKTALTIMALEDKDPEVRVSAALALLRIDTSNNSAMKFLIASLKNDKQGTAGPEAAAYAFQQLGPRAKSAFPDLIEATKHKDNGVRMNAIDSITAIDGKSAVKPLIDSLSDKDYLVRWAALRALGKLGPISAPSVPQIIIALNDDDYLVSEAAAKSLGQIGPKAIAAITHLKEISESDRNDDLKKIAANSLKLILAKP